MKKLLKNPDFHKFSEKYFKKSWTYLEPWDLRECMAFFPHQHIASKKIVKIVDSILKNENYSWESLSLYEESMIQKLLIKENTLIKCHGLVQFPTNSFDFQSLIVKNPVHFLLKKKSVFIYQYLKTHIVRIILFLFTSLFLYLFYTNEQFLFIGIALIYFVISIFEK